ncbi:uncharacterized protein [Euphorbia lathyris]|uniref:uncharacterized protein n=1 Tax=Euphorbia lathyris TaxID=212925 RepID=UPI0033142EAA
MVTVSFHRGNVHRVPIVRRRLLMSSRRISFKEFKSLFHRRSLALSRLHSPDVTVASPNPNSNANDTAIDSQSNDDKGANRCVEGTSMVEFCGKVTDQGRLEVGQFSDSLNISDVSNSPPPDDSNGGDEADENLQDLGIEKTDVSANPNIESTAIADATNHYDKKKREEEEEVEESWSSESEEA